jgi:NADP-dependent 3-hydroxy acid dehydrogenase YdfG
MRLDPRSILITGASSGIGRAVARAYAEPGRRLTLLGRNADRLRAVAA